MGGEIQRELKGKFPSAVRRKKFAQCCYQVCAGSSLIPMTRRYSRLESDRLVGLHKAVKIYLAGEGWHKVGREVQQLDAALSAAIGHSKVERSDPFTIWGTLAINYFQILGKAPTHTDNGPFYRVVRIILRHIDGRERQYPTRIVAAAVLHLKAVFANEP